MVISLMTVNGDRLWRGFAVRIVNMEDGRLGD